MSITPWNAGPGELSSDHDEPDPRYAEEAARELSWQEAVEQIAALIDAFGVAEVLRMTSRAIVTHEATGERGTAA